MEQERFTVGKLAELAGVFSLKEIVKIFQSWKEMPVCKIDDWRKGKVR